MSQAMSAVMTMNTAEVGRPGRLQLTAAVSQAGLLPPGVDCRL
jgi:hypothetical protein